VQLFHGIVDNMGEIPQPAATVMAHNGQRHGNSWLFRGTIPCRSSGHYGYTVRVLPRHPDLGSPFEPGLVVWG
jgi:starch phosphorylase